VVDWKALDWKVTVLLTVTPLMTTSKTGAVEPTVVIGVHWKVPLPLATVLIELARRVTSGFLVLSIFCLSEAPEMSSGVSLAALAQT